MIGIRIKEIRQAKNISQKELAERTKMNQCQISKIEQNRRNVYADEILCFAEALGVPIGELLEDKSA